jgi:hypothetical protein
MFKVMGGNMKSIYRILFFIPLIPGLSAFAFDYTTIPDMTWKYFGGGPRSAKTEFATAYDHVNNVWVSGFGCGGGGAVASCYSSDTYEFNSESGQWECTYDYYCRKTEPAGWPPARCTDGMCFSSRDTVVMLLGGANIGSVPDTWLYSAGRNQWTLKCRQVLGGGCAGLRPVYDEVTDLFYTFDFSLPQMYKYAISTNRWVSTRSLNPPQSSSCYVMAISEKRRIILLVTSSSPQTHVYFIDQNRWQKVADNSGALGDRYRSGMVYDMVGDVFLLLAGKNSAPDLWVLELSHDNTRGTWTNITGQVSGNFPVAGSVASYQSAEAFCYDRTHNVSWIDGHGRGLHAFRYRNAVTNIKLAQSRPVRALLSCFPNPLYSSTLIQWHAPLSMQMPGRLSVYSPQGALVRSFTVDSPKGRILWEAANAQDGPLGSGHYLLTLVGGKRRIVYPLIITK